MFNIQNNTYPSTWSFYSSTFSLPLNILVCISKISRPTLVTTQAHIQGIPGYFPRAKVMLTIHLHPAASLRMSGAIPLLPQLGFMVWTDNFNFTFPSNTVHDLVCLPRNATATTKYAVTCTYTAYCCIWLKYTVTWIYATWCSNTPVLHQLCCIVLWNETCVPSTAHNKSDHNYIH